MPKLGLFLRYLYLDRESFRTSSGLYLFLCIIVNNYFIIHIISPLHSISCVAVCSSFPHEHDTVGDVVLLEASERHILGFHGRN